MNPTALIGGHSVCCGCGSESISCTRVSALMNVTLCPTEIVTVFGSTTPPARIVIVAPLGPGPFVSGVSGFWLLLPPPPQFVSAVETRKTENTPTRILESFTELVPHCLRIDAAGTGTGEDAAARDNRIARV